MRSHRLPRGLGATAAEVVVVATSLLYVVTGRPLLLLGWEAVATAYLLGGLLVAISQASRAGSGGRTGTLGTLSWLLPLASSVVGAVTAVQALSAQPAAQHGDPAQALLAVAASIGVIISWLLLQVGMAQCYQAIAERSATPSFAFPSTPSPVLVDFVYLAFAVGAAFATSDTQILRARVRLLVTVHSALAFFYSAFTIAIALQVLQAVLPGVRR